MCGWNELKRSRPPILGPNKHLYCGKSTLKRSPNTIFRSIWDYLAIVLSFPKLVGVQIRPQSQCSFLLVFIDLNWKKFEGKRQIVVRQPQTLDSIFENVVQTVLKLFQIFLTLRVTVFSSILATNKPKKQDKRANKKCITVRICLWNLFNIWE